MSIDPSRHSRSARLKAPDGCREPKVADTPAAFVDGAPRRRRRRWLWGSTEPLSRNRCHWAVGKLRGIKMVRSCFEHHLRELKAIFMLLTRWLGGKMEHKNARHVRL
jgi:hypothetical protein